MAKLGRASAGSDPNLDPLLNPNIRVGKNWTTSICTLTLLHTTSLCSLSSFCAVLYIIIPAGGAVYLNPLEQSDNATQNVHLLDC